MTKISHPARNEPHCRMILFQLRWELSTIARCRREFAGGGFTADALFGHDSSRQVSSISVTMERVFRMWKAAKQAAQTWLSASKIED
jgi:hypothetical protein